jgi:hypothetical protein
MRSPSPLRRHKLEIVLVEITLVFGRLGRGRFRRGVHLVLGRVELIVFLVNGESVERGEEAISNGFGRTDDAGCASGDVDGEEGGEVDRGFGEEGVGFDVGDAFWTGTESFVRVKDLNERRKSLASIDRCSS